MNSSIRNCLLDWEMQEAGWWTSEAGGVCYETDGWYAYRAAGESYVNRVGPFHALWLAAETLEKTIPVHRKPKERE